MLNALSLDVYCRKVLMDKAYLYPSVQGLYLLNHSSQDQPYVDRILLREKNSKPWSEYTLNKATTASVHCSNHHIASLFSQISKDLLKDTSEASIYSRWVLFSSMDSWDTAVVRYWCCRSKIEAKEFEFFKQWNGEDHIIVATKVQGETTEQVFESCGTHDAGTERSKLLKQ